MIYESIKIFHQLFAEHFFSFHRIICRYIYLLFNIQDNVQLPEFVANHANTPPPHAELYVDNPGLLCL